jgi:hypothetical protein|tara:strand:+ start:3879 stop:4466 length:588 start_codon:yes stop_codon:yes gene_type:complete
MISRQKQIFELRKSVIDELKIGTVKKRMIAVLRNKKQFASGNLQSVIEKIQYKKSIKVTNTEFEELTGFMYKATVEFRFNFKGAGYAKFLDIVPYSDIPHKSSGSGIKALINWINNKPSSTWKTQVDTSNPKKVKRLAHAIFTSQKNRGGVENKSNFITFTRSNITSSINRASQRFVNYLSKELYLELNSQIFYR